MIVTIASDKVYREKLAEQPERNVVAVDNKRRNWANVPYGMSKLS